MKEHVLVTGGCGFVGINTVKLLEAEGYEISVLDNLTTGIESDLMETSATLFRGDIRNVSDLERAFQDIDAVVHLAAHTRVVESVDNPQENFDINAQGTLNVLEIARRHGVKRIVMASTGGAIIGDVTPPVHEEMVPRPLSPYGASKLAAEGYGSAFAGSYGLDVIGLRFANVYGPYSYHKGSVVARFFKELIDGRPWTIYGDGTQTRDFVYVGDVAYAIVLATRSTIEGFHQFNIGTGVETDINNLASMIQEVVGVRHQVQHHPARTGEVLRNYSNIEKARKGLEFEPHTPLASGLRATWKWFSKTDADAST